MFTQNCDVKTDEVMQSQVERPKQHQQRGSRKRRADAAEAAGAPPPGGDVAEDVMHPVCCAVCDTRVGAQDSDEVVHFFHVLASEC